MSDQNTILPDILTDETKIFILSADRQHMFPTGTIKIVIGLTLIPNLYLHQITHLVQSCSGPVATNNC